jgi:hypothetical protein
MDKIRIINSAKQAKNDPLGFAVDKLISSIINYISPIPVPTIIISQLRVPIIGLLGTIILVIILLLMLSSTIILFPTFVGANIADRLSSLIEGANALDIPVDSSFTNVKVPNKNPLGGKGLEYVSTTAGFMDSSYFLQFGKAHTGIDLVPNTNYYENNESYKTNKAVIIYATHSGKATSYVDGNGGNTVEILSSNGNLKTKYIHFKSILIDTGDQVIAGTPLGIMGKTGFATGEHVHYEVQIKDADTWKLVNPLEYIK